MGQQSTSGAQLCPGAAEQCPDVGMWGSRSQALSRTVTLYDTLWFPALSPPRCKAWCKLKQPHFSFETYLKYICKREDFWMTELRRKASPVLYNFYHYYDLVFFIACDPEEKLYSLAASRARQTEKKSFTHEFYGVNLPHINFHVSFESKQRIKVVHSVIKLFYSEL